ncbi:MAG: hypothetical protein EAZ92_16780 [Candidatus Kapaibacterium sp.]|nr:MAG: hypothetical protein EAZ92_16780 [Candidatus Kapabacteria bacterium]
MPLCTIATASRKIACLRQGYRAQRMNKAVFIISLIPRYFPEMEKLAVKGNARNTNKNFKKCIFSL